MGKKKGRAKGEGSSGAANQDDDSLLDAAIAEASQAKKQIEDDKEAAEIKKMQDELARRNRMVEAQRQRGLPTGLSKEEIVTKLNEIPTFALVHQQPDGSKKFVPMKFKETEKGEVNEEAQGSSDACVFFSDVHEAKSALQQGLAQAPSKALGIGVMPLGKAYALTAGWADASTPNTVPFALRGAAAATHELAPVLKQQLEKQGLSTEWCFPVFLCEELQSEACLPVFLTREGLATTWKQAKKDEPLPQKFTVTDLRIIIGEMQRPFKETGCDWSIVQFLGSESGYAAVKANVEKELGASSSLDGKAKPKEQETAASVTLDPDAEPPELV